MRRLTVLAALLAVVTASPAHASELIDRNASGATLAVNDKGEALLAYRAEANPSASWHGAPSTRSPRHRLAGRSSSSSTTRAATASSGAKYRATIIGPRVTPDVLWEGPAPGAYDRAVDQAANGEQHAAFRDGVCKIN